MGNLTDRVAYLKGLADGMKLTEDTNEHKLLLKMLDVLEAMAAETDNVIMHQEEISDFLENVDDDLSELEDYVYDEEPAGCNCGHHHHMHDNDDDDEDALIEYECSHCGFKAQLDMSDFDYDEDFLCPRCGQPFFEEDDDDEEDEAAEGEQSGPDKD